MNKYSPLGVDLFGDPINTFDGGVLAHRYIIPPMSILHAGGQEWLRRKRAWIARGVQAEIGREARVFDMAGAIGVSYNRRELNDTSLFDPVLCELLYTWYCVPSGQVVDPFAGGAVRGFVAAKLGLSYWGCDLSAEQITANRRCAVGLVPMPQWIVGDARDVLGAAPVGDFLFSCPPYWCLERYSDNSADLSNMSETEFQTAHANIIRQAVGRLAADRFAVWVVGDVRRPNGTYYPLVFETMRAFVAAGCGLYAHFIVEMPYNTAPVRADNQFAKNRKPVTVHQSALVFIKGDWCRAVGYLDLHED